MVTHGNQMPVGELGEEVQAAGEEWMEVTGADRSQVEEEAMKKRALS